MSNANTESILLVERFFLEVKGISKDEKNTFPGNASWKKLLLENAHACLQAGYPYYYIREMFKDATEKDKDVYSIADYLRTRDSKFTVGAQERASREPFECIQFGSFYNHPILQETSGKPTYVWNEMDYSITPVEPEVFFLEIIESFTISDLTDYFIRKMDIELINKKSIETQFARIVKQFGLDLTLYIIDSAVIDVLENQKQKISSPFFLTDYIKDAKHMLLNRKQILVQGGINHVIPRRYYQQFDN